MRLIEGQKSKSGLVLWFTKLQTSQEGAVKRVEISNDYSVHCMLSIWQEVFEGNIFMACKSRNAYKPPPVTLQTKQIMFLTDWTYLALGFQFYSLCLSSVHLLHWLKPFRVLGVRVNPRPALPRLTPWAIQIQTAQTNCTAYSQLDKDSRHCRHLLPEVWRRWLGRMGWYPWMPRQCWPGSLRSLLH